MNRCEPIWVECYSGYKGDETPRKFSWKGKEYGVHKVIARWYERGVDSQDSPREFFRVLDGDKEEYVLRHTVKSATWEIMCRKS